MASTKTIGTGLLVVGVVLLIASLGADVIGLGGGGRFGGQQIAGTAAGIILILVGLIYSRR